MQRRSAPNSRQPEEVQFVLRPYVLRGLSLPVLQALTTQLQPVWVNRQGLNLSQTGPSLTYGKIYWLRH